MKLTPISRELVVGDIFVDMSYDSKRVYIVLKKEEDDILLLRFLGLLSQFNTSISFPAQESFMRPHVWDMTPYLVEF